jgi:hypothetical protein
MAAAEDEVGVLMGRSLLLSEKVAESVCKCKGEEERGRKGTFKEGN